MGLKVLIILRLVNVSTAQKRIQRRGGGLVKVPNQISKESRVYLTAYFPQASHRKSQTSSASTLLEKVLPDIAVFN